MIGDIRLKVTEEDPIKFKMGEGGAIGATDDYEKLKNLPTLDGVEIRGEMKERDPTVPDWAKKDQKPVYKASEVGALSVDDEITAKEYQALEKIIFG